MGFSKEGGGGGCCKIGREERMRAILTWVLVIVVCARTASAVGERVGRGGSQALYLPNQLPGSYSFTTTPHWLEDCMLF